MDRDLAGYESFFEFEERPFSLTSDSRYYFRSRSHGASFDAMATALSRRERIVLLSGDLGVGKTTLCRTLVDVVASRARVAMVSHPWVTPPELERRLLGDLGAMAPDELAGAGVSGESDGPLRERLERFLAHVVSTRERVVLIIDEAQNLPPATAELVVELSQFEVRGDKPLQVMLAAQAAGAGTPTLAPAFANRLSTRARLTPLDRDECSRYLTHRVTIAGGGATVTFAPHALEVMFGLSGGLPRLINLIAERALHEAASASSHRIEASMVETAASALEILRLRPRRFRWYGAAEAKRS
jgi:general secretion pathway protein A